MSLRLTKVCSRRSFMEQELSYSFHLGSDKNKSKVAKKVAKGNVSGTTSLSNNAIQTAKDLSDVNKHNLRDYDNERELIRTIYGTDDIVKDVQDLYINEFEGARLEYNNKQTRSDRKIANYFEKVCSSQNDIACEIIVELGDMDFWNDKDEEYKCVSEDLHKAGVFTDDDFEIATNAFRKVKPKEEIAEKEQNKVLMYLINSV